MCVAARLIDATLAILAIGLFNVRSIIMIRREEIVSGSHGFVLVGGSVVGW